MSADHDGGLSWEELICEAEADGEEENRVEEHYLSLGEEHTTGAVPPPHLLPEILRSVANAPSNSTTAAVGGTQVFGGGPPNILSSGAAIATETSSMFPPLEITTATRTTIRSPTAEVSPSSSQSSQETVTTTSNSTNVANPYRINKQSSSSQTTPRIINPYSKKRRRVNSNSDSFAWSRNQNHNHQAGHIHTRVNNFERPASSTPTSSGGGSPTRRNFNGNPSSSSSLEEKLGDFDLFFSMLLRHPLRSYLDAAAAQNNTKADELWSDLCSQAGLNKPTCKIQASYANNKDHFAIRAALMLEEIREEICGEVDVRWGAANADDEKTTKKKYPWIIVPWKSGSSSSSEQNKSSVHNIRISPPDDGRRENEFTSEEISYFGGFGTIVECIPCGKDIHHQNVFWGRLDHIQKKKKKEPSYGIISFLNGFKPMDGIDLRVRPLGDTQISGYRQYWACTDDRFHRVEFINSVIRGSTTTNTPSSPQRSPTKTTRVFAELVGPSLNHQQQQAVKDFLSCPSGTLQVVQGPPGCGKTTLLVSLILNYLENRSENRNKLMVCAPTNKAISVVAHRFMAEICPNGNEPDVGITVVGNFDKLSDGLGNQSPLRPFCLDEFLKVIKSEIGRVMDYCNPEKKSEETSTGLCLLLRRIQSRLKKRLKHLPETVTSAVESLCEAMEGYQASTGVTLQAIPAFAQKVFDVLRKEKVQKKYKDDLLLNTDVFFCTLLSSGRVDMKNVIIHDLVVDEAAAATEPALYIPFRLGPKRMIVVGDPMQLPAVVKSEKAESLGLAESLHERLMKRCGYKFTMLAEQFRMNPEISAFPSQQFYNGKIADGSNVCCPKYGTKANVALAGKPFVFYNVRGEIKQIGSSIHNELEAEAVVDVVTKLSKQGQRKWNAVSRLRVITFYRPQQALIQRMLQKKGLKNVEVATVDSSQGCEADVVIVSFVRGGTALAGFLKDDRRINVALTRAKHQLICIGNVYGLQELGEAKARTLRLLSENAQERGMVRSRLS